jgi:hypothetical protein
LNGYQIQYRVFDANGNELPFDPFGGPSGSTTVTLGATPLHLKLRMFGWNATVSKSQSPFNTTRKLQYAGVIFGIMLLGGARRKSWRKTMAKLLVAILFVSAVGTVLSSCSLKNGNFYSNIDLNATPNHSQAPGGAPQDVTFWGDPHEISF